MLPEAGWLWLTARHCSGMALAPGLQKNRECIFLSHDLGPECNLLWVLAKVVTSRNLSTLFGFLYLKHPEDRHHMTGYNWTQHQSSTQRLASEQHGGFEAVEFGSNFLEKQLSKQHTQLPVLSPGHTCTLSLSVRSNLTLLEAKTLHLHCLHTTSSFLCSS